jgi:hypothetical protein
MAGITAANFLITWVFLGATHEAGGDGMNAVKLAVCGFKAPVTTTGERGGLDSGGNFSGWRGVLGHGFFFRFARGD